MNLAFEGNYEIVVSETISKENPKYLVRTMVMTLFLPPLDIYVIVITKHARN